MSRVAASARVDRRRLTCLARRRVAERKVNNRVVEAQSSQRHLRFRVLRCLDWPNLKHSRNLRAFDFKVQKRTGACCATCLVQLQCARYAAASALKVELLYPSPVTALVRRWRYML